MALHSPCGILDIYAPASSVRGLGASFSEPRYRARGAAELSGFAVANAAGHRIGVPKGAQSENSHVFNYFKIQTANAKIRCLVSLVRSKSRKSKRPRLF
jgi:hypothetical protein